MLRQPISAAFMVSLFSVYFSHIKARQVVLVRTNVGGLFYARGAHASGRRAWTGLRSIDA